MGLFGCSHPAWKLFVYKDETREEVSNYFEDVTYHLMCSCEKKIDIKYAKTLPDFYDYSKEEILK